MEKNSCLESSYTYHNILDKLISRRVNDLLPIKPEEKQYNFILSMMKEDLIACTTYKLKYLLEETERMIIKDILKRGNEAIEELDAWIKIWFNKYLQRTKIVTKKDYDNMQTILTKYAECSRMIAVPEGLIKELEQVSIETLVNNNEIACTKIMAKDIVLYALRTERKNFDPNMLIQDQLRLMNVVIRRTKSVCSMTGPLVFIKVG